MTTGYLPEARWEAEEWLLGFARALRAAGLPVTADRERTFLLALSEVEGKCFAILFVTIVEDDLGAVTARRRDLRCRRVFRHGNEHAHAGFTTRNRHRLRVIAR